VSDLTVSEKRTLEQLLGMEGRYVLAFTDRTFDEFIPEGTGRDIRNVRYDYRSSSKAVPLANASQGSSRR
jgi:hypothetical protein